MERPVNHFCVAVELRGKIGGQTAVRSKPQRLGWNPVLPMHSAGKLRLDDVITDRVPDHLGKRF